MDQETVGVKKVLPGPTNAKAVKRKGGVPSYKWTNEEEVEEGTAAVWSPHDVRFSNGVVLLNREFPLFVEAKRYWKDLYPDRMADDIDRVVEEVYGEVMVARIAHSEELCSDPRWGVTKVENDLRSGAALTMAALGLIGEDLLIKNRLVGRLGKTKAAA